MECRRTTSPKTGDRVSGLPSKLQEPRKSKILPLINADDTDQNEKSTAGGASTPSREARVGDPGRLCHTILVRTP